MKYVSPREALTGPEPSLPDVARPADASPDSLTASNAGSRSLRTTRMRSAVLTSIVSKVATVAFQLLAIPVAVRALGPSQYAAFLVVSSTLAWISLGGLGVAPGVTGYVARAIGRGSLSDARQVITTGLVMSLVSAMATAALIAVAVVVVARSDAVADFLDPSFAPYLPSMAGATFVVVVTGLVQFPTSVIQAARAGALEQHISNIWRIVGTTIGLASMFAVAVWSPTMVGFAMALAAPSVVAGIGDSMGFLVRHPELLPRASNVSKNLIAPLLSAGAGFLAFSAGGFLISGLSLVLASSSVPAEKLAPVGILFQLQALGVGLVNMVAIPLWPSVAHADAASDREWVIRAYHVLRRLAVAAGLIGFVGIVAILPLVAKPIFGDAVTFDLALTLPFGALFVVACWGMLHAFVLFGLGSALLVGVLTVMQGAIALVLLVATVDTLGASAVGISALVAALTVTAWVLPRHLHRRLEAIGS